MKIIFYYIFYKIKIDRAIAAAAAVAASKLSLLFASRLDTPMDHCQRFHHIRWRRPIVYHFPLRLAPPPTTAFDFRLITYARTLSNRFLATRACNIAKL